MAGVSVSPIVPSKSKSTATRSLSTGTLEPKSSTGADPAVSPLAPAATRELSARREFAAVHIPLRQFCRRGVDEKAVWAEEDEDQEARCNVDGTCRLEAMKAETLLEQSNAATWTVRLIASAQK